MDGGEGDARAQGPGKKEIPRRRSGGGIDPVVTGSRARAILCGLPAKRLGPSTNLESPGERPRRECRDCGGESTPPYRIRRIPGGGERSWTGSGGPSTVVGADGR